MPIPSAGTNVATTAGAWFPSGEPVSVITAGVTLDPYSNQPTESWADADVTVVEVERCAVEPRPSGEPVQDARNAVTSGFTIYMPSGVAIGARSRVQVRGQVYNVLGEPAVWRNPFTGWAPGIVVQVERTEG